MSKAGNQLAKDNFFACKDKENDWYQIGNSKNNTKFSKDDIRTIKHPANVLLMVYSII